MKQCFVKNLEMFQAKQRKFKSVIYVPFIYFLKKCYPDVGLTFMQLSALILFSIFDIQLNMQVFLIL